MPNVAATLSHWPTFLGCGVAMSFLVFLVGGFYLNAHAYDSGLEIIVLVLCIGFGFVIAAVAFFMDLIVSSFIDPRVGKRCVYAITGSLLVACGVSEALRAPAIGWQQWLVAAVTLALAGQSGWMAFKRFDAGSSSDGMVQA